MSWLIFLMATQGWESLISEPAKLHDLQMLATNERKLFPFGTIDYGERPTTWPRWRHSFRTGWWEAHASWYPWLDWHVQTTVESLITRTPKIRASPFIGTFSMAPATQCVQNFPWNEDTSFNQDRLCCPKAVHNRDRGSTVAGNQQGL